VLRSIVYQLIVGVIAACSFCVGTLLWGLITLKCYPGNNFCDFHKVLLPQSIKRKMSQL
jgi:hypothetical protein